jgi:hypothetical protein
MDVHLLQLNVPTAKMHYDDSAPHPLGTAGAGLAALEGVLPGDRRRELAGRSRGNAQASRTIRRASRFADRRPPRYDRTSRLRALAGTTRARFYWWRLRVRAKIRSTSHLDQPAAHRSVATALTRSGSRRGALAHAGPAGRRSPPAREAWLRSYRASGLCPHWCDTRRDSRLACAADAAAGTLSLHLSELWGTSSAKTAGHVVVRSMRTAVRSAVHLASAIGVSAVTCGAVARRNSGCDLARAVLGAQL